MGVRGGVVAIVLIRVRKLVNNIIINFKKQKFRLLIGVMARYDNSTRSSKFVL